jgi:hypothetical protein
MSGSDPRKRAAFHKPQIVFELQQLQRDVHVAFALAVYFEPVGLWPTRSEFHFGPSEQPCLDGSLVHVIGQRPVEPGALCAFEVTLHRPPKRLYVYAGFTQYDLEKLALRTPGRSRRPHSE